MGLILKISGRHGIWKTLEITLIYRIFLLNHWLEFFDNNKCQISLSLNQFIYNKLIIQAIKIGKMVIKLA
jgi:hypothetical protein